ncbi:TauD/TfdA family dioxygenase [Marinomonas pollencensis]|uniref:Gamma-butyrobetaine dioxygenase n=1 Tax=Marinomonas pollencensis TaxID=491954 RepID=A0A3E0D6M1_9GAMM|nr:TauD/TfdA family dioxygenase [Marinomonas pollencensis]REG78204.1 gamma-butyrobetaine dioxygenase [Marinomonas pollencensis]
MQHVEFTVDEDSASIIAHFQGQELSLPALWLRERCQDAVQLDQVTQQRLFDPHQLENDVSLVKVEKQGELKYGLTFSDGYEGSYDFTEFYADFDIYDGAPTPVSWKAGFDTSKFHVKFDEIFSDEGFMAGVEKFLTYGVLIVDDVPRESGSVLKVANRFGHVRETNFGNSFEVYTRPDYNDLSGQPVPLGPHTDNPYRDPMPGIQLLHCIQNETSGGLSTLVDSLSVLKQLKAEDPEGYQLLSDVPVRYRHVDNDVELIERRTMIESDHTGKVTGIAYSPRLDYLPLLENDQLVKFHRARKRLGALLGAPEFEWRFRLEPGQLQMFHNTRVLHGRTGFDATEGLRHLEGAYIDLDAPKGRYKAIKRQTKLAQKGA